MLYKFVTIKKLEIMNGFIDPKSPNFLGGNNVHHVVMILALGYLVYKAAKK